ncbi:hypothetical protein CYMTET_22260 [Cymbomonas tetramitiformis]|uniref:ATP-dependent RNA helicase n=1 Tax=Cymbomonas tetramitiformis TaxID=36881 RepID=A0AAE0G164_9CHLO|nr:hypothetical protein CYMTET_22260 [Cymbomonas tetramitiformis]
MGRQKIDGKKKKFSSKRTPDKQNASVEEEPPAKKTPLIPWGDHLAWKTIHTSEEAFMEDGEGFLSLEELEDDGTFDIPAGEASVKAASLPEKKEKPKKKRKRKSKKKDKERNEADDVDEAAIPDGRDEDGEPPQEVSEAWARFGLHPVAMGLRLWLLIGVAMGTRAVRRLAASIGAPAESKFTQPAKIQEESSVAIQSRQDVIGAAETGSGKTLAFGLPILHRLLCEMDEQDSRRASGAMASGEDGEMVTGDDGDSGDESEEDGGGMEDQAREETELDGEAGEAMEPEEQGITEVEDVDVEQLENVDDWEMQQPEKSTREDGLRALIIAPTRELALQVNDHLQKMAKNTRVRVAPIVGGISAQKQRRLLNMRPQVIVATPGRLWEYMDMGDEHLCNLQKLEFLVIDEADRMVEKGYFAELTSILGKLPQHPKKGEDARAAGKGKTQSKKQKQQEHQEPEGEEAETAAAATGSDGEAGRQTFVFSATLALPPSLRKRLKLGESQLKSARKVERSSAMEDLMAQIQFRGQPKVVDLTSSRITASSLLEAMIACSEDERDFYMYYLLNRYTGRTIVFCNAISALRRVSGILRQLEVPAVALHSNQQQRQRLKALDKFKSGAATVLVASDVAARGLDIPKVRCVIHYQVPASADIYVHRSGRTARAGMDGLSIALVTPPERHRYIAVCKSLDRESGLSEFPVEAAYMPTVRERVKLALKVDALDRTQSKDHAEKAWFRRNAEQMEMMVEEEDEDDDKARMLRKEAQKLRTAQAALKANLAKPLLPQSGGMLGKFLGQGERLEAQQAAAGGSELQKSEAVAAFNADSTGSSKSSNIASLAKKGPTRQQRAAQKAQQKNKESTAGERSKKKHRRST